MKKLILGVTLALTGCFALQGDYLHAEIHQEIVQDINNKQDLLEQDSWRYLESQFTDLITDQITVTKKLGKFMQDNVLVWSIPAIAAGEVLVFLGLIHLEKKYPWPFKNCPEGLGGPLVIGLLMGGGAIGFAISYKLSHVIGSLLEARPEDCVRSLKNFLAKWPAHKARTPATMQPIFETLYQDLSLNKQNFASIKTEEAQKLVEMILAMSLLVSVIK